MKKTSTLLALVFGLFAMNAQEFRGIATYMSKTSTDDVKLDSPQITPEMKEMIQEQMRLMSEKTFTLTFDKNTSLYEEEVVLTPGGGGMFEGMRMMSNTMYGGDYYKNTKDKVFIQEREIFGKEFLIKDSLQVYDWQLETETKQIGNYMCYKATAVVPFDLTDFKNMTRKEPKDEKEREAQENSTNFLDMIDVPTEVVITAWYTPQIPISQGPSNY